MVKKAGKKIVKENKNLDDIVDFSVDVDSLDISEFEDPVVTKTALTVFQKRILQKDEDGNPIETPKDLYLRVATNIAKADINYGDVTMSEFKDRVHEFYSLMANRDFLPNSPTLTGAGVDGLQMLSGCFVLPVYDSMDGIFDTLRNTAKVHQKGGGTGFSFGNLRRRGDIVGSSKGVSSGPVSFMKTFNAATEQVKQGGTRRGANMGILPYDHPDVYEFINCKQKEGEMENFNISVAVSDDFMRKVKIGGYFELYSPKKGKRYKLKATDLFSIDNPKYSGDVNDVPSLAKSVDGKSVILARTGEEVGKIEDGAVYLSAKKLWDEITYNAWKSGDPGIVFIDKLNKDNPTPHIGTIESTNPCGEQPLLPYESCNLGSINLGNMVKGQAGKKEIDYDKLESVVYSSVHFLDNVIDMNNYPLDQIAELTRANRKIGLGVMGLHDMLIELETSYASEEGRALAGKVMSFIDEKSKEASEGLAKKRGAFPNFKGSIYDNGNGRLMRNATTTTIAPTGTLSMLVDASSGIEPLFSIVYEKTCLDDDTFDMTPAVVKRRLYDLVKSRPDPNAEMKKLIDKIKKNKGRLGGISEIPKSMQTLFASAQEINHIDHLLMQAEIQKYVDNAVSKTINLPNEATVEDIRKIYEVAYDLGCKGVTIYRDGSKNKQVLNAGVLGEDLTFKQKLELLAQNFKGDKITNNNLERNPAVIYHVKVGVGAGKPRTMHVILEHDHRGFPIANYIILGPPGSEAALSCLDKGLRESRYLRDAKEPDLVKMITDRLAMKGPNQVGFGENAIYSIEHGYAVALLEHFNNGYRLIGKDEMGTLEQKVFKNGTNENKDIKRYDKTEKKIKKKKVNLGLGSCPECSTPYTQPPTDGCSTPVCDFCGYSKCG